MKFSKFECVGSKFALNLPKCGSSLISLVMTCSNILVQPNCAQNIGVDLRHVTVLTALACTTKQVCNASK